MSMIQKLRENKQEIKRLRKDGMKIKELALLYDVSYGSMAHFLTTHQITLHDNNIQPEIISKILDDYRNGVSYEVIAKSVHMDKEAVRNIIIDNGIEIRDKSHSLRKYYVDESYFDSIDTPNKAYILGLLYADGNITSNKNHYTLRLKLQDRDMDILYKINQEIKNERPLKFENCSYKPNTRNQYSLIVDNKQIATSLKKWGISPNKVYSTRFPDWLEDNLFSHFIRGYMDGDGTISHSPSSFKAGCTGNYDFISHMRNYIEEKLGVHFSLTTGRGKTETVTSITISGKYQVKKFLDYIYKDANLYMNRKHGYYLYMYSDVSGSFCA